MASEDPPDQWLLLIHQLPKEPAYLRVKIGRQLARVGAIALKNSVYALPRTEGTTEDFQWVRRQIVEGGGEATVVEAQLLEGLSDAEIQARFRETKDAQYAELAREAREVAAPSGRRKRPLTQGERAAILAEVARLEERLAEVAATDFFGASGREIVAGLLCDLRSRAEPPVASIQAEPGAARPQGATWVTRVGVHVDRIASAWLIRRCVDPGATFKFVPAQGYVPEPGELRFDMFEAEYSHEGDRCTFETLLARFAVKEAGLRAVAEVVHDIDIKDGKFARPETAGVAACIAGMCRTTQSDVDRLRAGSALFESLLAHYAKNETQP